MKFRAVLWKEWIVFKRKFVGTTLGSVIGPLLYLIAFGWGLGKSVTMGTGSYTAFVIPGIIAMNSMTNSYSPIANDINISRIYGQTFESTMTAPVNMGVFAAARITAGAIRGFYSALLILAVSYLFQSDLKVDWYFLLVLVMNCFVFSAIGFIAGIVIDSHADMSKVTNFIITPMSFLCGTFFPLDKFPELLQTFFRLLPLTQAVKGMREGVHAAGSLLVPAVLAGYLAVLMIAAIYLCKKAE